MLLYTTDAHPCIVTIKVLTSELLNGGSHPPLRTGSLSLYISLFLICVSSYLDSEAVFSASNDEFGFKICLLCHELIILVWNLVLGPDLHNVQIVRVIVLLKREM